MSDQNISIKINGKDFSVSPNLTILDACTLNGIHIPTLCYMDEVSTHASCGVCCIEVVGAKALVRSCANKVRAGMEILTNTKRVRDARRVVTELILAQHPQECLECNKNQNCELQKLAEKQGIEKVRYQKMEHKRFNMDLSSPSVSRDPNKCILCGRCVEVCKNMQSVQAIDFTGRGKKTRISTFADEGMGMSQCVNCGQCVVVCPTGALSERNYVSDVWDAIADPDKVVVVQTAPAIRAGIGEDFGFPAGTCTTGKLAAALHRLGFDKIFDTQFTADLTIMEEGTELIGRIKNGGTLPMITSCCPGWIKFAEEYFPESLDHLSTCKSPQQMLGPVAKTYYAEKMGIDPRKLVVVSIMPCTAKKFENNRPELNDAFKYWKDKLNLRDDENFLDVDYVLTTREAVEMIQQAGIDFASLPDEDFDNPLGDSTGAATIFGATGGVMEAAVRTAYAVLTGGELGNIELTPVRGMEGIKDAELDVAGLKVKVAIAHGLANARKLMEDVRDGKSPYHFIEIMTCSGGCIGGGGQPAPFNNEIRAKRIEALYEEDRRLAKRQSHHNASVTKLYEEFLKEPNGHLSHQLLHTKYFARDTQGQVKKKVNVKK